jgi:citrate synthase
MKANSLTHLIFHELLGKDPSPKEESFLDEAAPIVADFKHDFLEPPSSTSVALSVACGKNLYETLSNSMGLWGSNHFVFSKVVRQWRTGEYPERIAGMGHPKFKGPDPRSVEIEHLALKYNISTRSLSSFKEFANEKQLNVNLAGCLGLILWDMGFTEENVDFFPMIWRLVGLTKLYGFLNGEIKLGAGIDCVKKAYTLIYPNRNDDSKT